MRKAFKTLIFFIFICTTNTLLGQIDQFSSSKPHCCTKKKSEKLGFCEKHGDLIKKDKVPKETFQIFEIFSFDVGVGPLEVEVELIQDSSEVYMVSIYSEEAISREMNYSMYSESGEQKETSDFLQQNIDIDMSLYQSGAYFLKIRNDLLGERIYKIVKP